MVRILSFFKLSSISILFFPLQKEWERKESLLLRSASLLERAKHWEHAVPIWKELARVYEGVLFDYRKLAEALRRQAALAERIVLSGSAAAASNTRGGGDTALRLEPEYFLVAFRGAGLPTFLRVRRRGRRGGACQGRTYPFFSPAGNNIFSSPPFPPAWLSVWAQGGNFSDATSLLPPAPFYQPNKNFPLRTSAF